MTDEEAKMRAALEQERQGLVMRLYQGGAGTLNTAQRNPHLEYAEAQKEVNADAQALFIALCKEMRAIGAVQVNCGIFQVTFREVAR